MKTKSSPLPSSARGHMGDGETSSVPKSGSPARNLSEKEVFMSLAPRSASFRRGVHTEFSEADMSAIAFLGAAVPHGAKFARRDFEERGIGIVRAGIVEGLFFAPRAA